jgi:NAD(P)-dependent dehydrogenase (short-subunit alcohol dehydrogenase family)
VKLAAPFDVTGLITSGAGDIGYAYADAMADNGAGVALLDIDRTRLRWRQNSPPRIMRFSAALVSFSAQPSRALK